MNATPKTEPPRHASSRPASAEQRFKELKIELPEKNPCRLVYGVASLPLGVPIELEVILEVA